MAWEVECSAIAIYTALVYVGLLQVQLLYRLLSSSEPVLQLLNHCCLLLVIYFHVLVLLLNCLSNCINLCFRKHIEQFHSCLHKISAEGIGMTPISSSSNEVILSSYSSPANAAQEELLLTHVSRVLMYAMTYSALTVVTVGRLKPLLKLAGILGSRSSL